MHSPRHPITNSGKPAIRFGILTTCLTLVVLLIAASDGLAQGRKLQIDYTVKIASVPDRIFHVTADIRNINESTLDLSLPTWTPGWYTIENYYKNVLRFQVTDLSGKRLPHTMILKQTWRVDTTGINALRAEFDYYADVLSLNQAKIADNFAFFTGT